MRKKSVFEKHKFYPGDQVGLNVIYQKGDKPWIGLVIGVFKEKADLSFGYIVPIRATVLFNKPLSPTSSRLVSLQVENLTLI